MPDQPDDNDFNFDHLLVYSVPQISHALERVLQLAQVGCECQVLITDINPTAITNVTRVVILVEADVPHDLATWEYEIWVDDYELIFRLWPLMG